MDFNRNRAALYAIVNATLDVTADIHPNRNIKHVADIVSKSSRYLQLNSSSRYSMSEREAKQWLAVEADVLLQVAGSFTRNLDREFEEFEMDEDKVKPAKAAY